MAIEGSFTEVVAMRLPHRSAEIAVRVEAWAACRCAGPDVEWFGAPPSARLLPSILRRRVTRLGQMAFEAAFCLRIEDVSRFIFCSRHGEYARTKSLLAALAANDLMSPADFSLSVHHALAGLLSIACGNVGGHSSIAAGADSFGYGLLDAAASLAAGDERRVLLVYFDEPLPSDYSGFCAEQNSFAAALLLGGSAGDDLRLALDTAAEPRPDRSATAEAESFVDFLRSNAASGAHGRWRWRRAAV